MADRSGIPLKKGSRSTSLLETGLSNDEKDWMKSCKEVLDTVWLENRLKILDTLGGALILISEGMIHDNLLLTSYDIVQNGVPMDRSVGKMLIGMKSHSSQLENLLSVVTRDKYVWSWWMFACLISHLSQGVTAKPQSSRQFESGRYSGHHWMLLV